ncbi:phosphate uptake regulator PhoU [Candidatus Woesearchaeota archaeon]|nr:phosphate uptake regulator PhoU [Candidatus Woesearchaeota archaeon]
MRRRLIRQGGGTLTVSLPKEWVEREGLSAGREVELIPGSRELSIRLSAGGARASSIDVSSLASGVARGTIIARYIRGADELRITHGEAQLELVQGIVDNLIGFAVVEQEAERCVAKQLTADADTDCLQLLRRMYRLVLDLGERCAADAAVRAGGRKPLTSPEVPEEQDAGINRLAYFTLRQLSRKPDGAQFGHLVHLLEMLGDEFVHLWGEVLSGTARPEHLKPVLSMARQCEKLLFTYDGKEAGEVTRARDRIRQLSKDYHVRKIAELCVNVLQAQLLLAPVP